MKLKSTSIRRPSIQWLAALSLCFSTAAWADQAWTGGGADALWTTTDNWNGTAVPASGELAIFNHSQIPPVVKQRAEVGHDGSPYFIIIGERISDRNRENDGINLPG